MSIKEFMFGKKREGVSVDLSPDALEWLVIRANKTQWEGMRSSQTDRDLDYLEVSIEKDDEDPDYTEEEIEAAESLLRYIIFSEGNFNQFERKSAWLRSGGPLWP